MAVRPGMSAILLYTRLKTDTREDETTVNGVAYWTDQQLQDMLDMHRIDARDIELIAYSEFEGGTNVTKRYYLPDTIGEWIEGSDTPDVFDVVDSMGNAAPSYTSDLPGRVIVFDDDTLGRSYFIRARFFDMRPALADIWLAKAGLRAELINWRAGGQNLQEDQEYKHCMEQYQLYSNILGISTVRMSMVGYG